MNNSKRLSISMTPMEAVWGWVYMPFFLFLLSYLLIQGCLLLGLDCASPGGQAWLNLVFLSVNFLACVVIFHDFLKKSLFKVKKSFWGFVQAVILGLVMYYAGNHLVNLAFSLLPDFSNVNNDQIRFLASGNRWVVMVGTVALAPLAEECLVRGLIFQGIFRKYRISAYVVSTLFFCLLHVMGYVGSFPWTTLLLCTVQYIPAGVSLAWAYEKADTIFAPILMHTLINAMAFGLLS